MNRSKKRSSIPESSAATGNDYGGGNGPGAVSPGPPWGAALATALLHADRGIGVATFITLLLVPVLYAIFVMDLKILKWETKEKQSPPGIAQVTDIAEHTAATA